MPLTSAQIQATGKTYIMLRWASRTYCSSSLHAIVFAGIWSLISIPNSISI